MVFMKIFIEKNYLMLNHKSDTLKNIFTFQKKIYLLKKINLIFFFHAFGSNLIMCMPS